MTIGIYGKEVTDTFLPAIQNLIEKLRGDGADVVILNDFYAFLEGKIKLTVPISTFSNYKEVSEMDMLLSVGGDGTFLSTILLVRDSGTPILGINTGRLGFLSNIATKEIEKSINKVFEKKYSLEERSLLSLHMRNNPFGNLNFALNEIALHKKDSASMIIIHAEVDNNFLNTYWADGILVATPTGSTAYSLSCGGPIVVPSAKSFVVTPIAPHNLNVRPIVVPDDVTIKLKAEGRDNQFLISLDSRSATIAADEIITIRKAPFSIKLVKPNESNFYNTMRQKLMWGKDKRN